jgi:hypothetical protein
MLSMEPVEHPERLTDGLLASARVDNDDNAHLVMAAARSALPYAFDKRARFVELHGLDEEPRTEHEAGNLALGIVGAINGYFGGMRHYFALIGINT